jgi:hypothetical protein
MFCTALLVATLLSFGQDISGADVIQAMHERYAGKWYENLALVQTVTYYDSDSGMPDSFRVWYESIRLPGTVRSDIAPLDAGNCELYAGEVWTRIQSDTVVRSFPGPHPILLLGFDVYVQPVDETLAKLEQLGVDLSKPVIGEWQGRHTYVVGDESRQFWVDVEDLLLVRLLLKNPNTDSERDIRLESYEPLGGGWIATELTFMRDGRADISERYDYWTIDVEFNPGIFVTEDRKRPAWIRN